MLFRYQIAAFGKAVERFQGTHEWDLVYLETDLGDNRYPGVHSVLSLQVQCGQSFRLLNESISFQRRGRMESSAAADGSDNPSIEQLTAGKSRAFCKWFELRSCCLVFMTTEQIITINKIKRKLRKLVMS